MEVKTKGCCSKILSWFKIFDTFGSTFQFKINREDDYRSSFGGIFYLIYFLFAFAYICLNFYNFATRKVLTLSYSNKIVFPPPVIKLNDTNFQFSLSTIYTTDMVR